MCVADCNFERTPSTGLEGSWNQPLIRLQRNRYQAAVRPAMQLTTPVTALIPCERDRNADLRYRRRRTAVSLQR